MPNWCENEMVVKGDPKRVAQFVEQMKGADENGDEIDLDFEAVIPMPRVLSGRKSPSDDKSPTWYDWQVENWGVKWGACDINLNYDDAIPDVAVYNFNTPWGPAISWQERVIEYFPWLSFSFAWREFGMQFAGEQHGEKGVAGHVFDREISTEEMTEYFGEEE